MSFSIKNIFQKGDSPEHGGAVALDSQPPGFGAGPSAGSPFSVAGTSEPGGFGGTLFRTVGNGEALDGAPVASNGSPFSPFGAAAAAVITVGDILPQLPPEIARANGAMPDQPVAIAPQVIENAITSGQLAVPVFEIYRVCPAMFQAPVSPHDPRLVPLPRNKLPGLIAAHTGALNPPPAQGFPGTQSPQRQGASPFTSVPMQVPSAGPSPFAPVLPEVASMSASEPPRTGSLANGVRPAGSLPPRRPQGMPPAIPTQADFAGGPGSLTLPGQMQPLDPHRPSSRPLTSALPGAPIPQGGSPFGMAQPPVSMGQPTQTSLLFGSQQQTADPELEAVPQQSAPSPFGAPSHRLFAGAPEASAFQGAMPSSAAPSPFMAPPQQGSPFAAPPVASFEVPQRHVESEPPRIGNLPFAAQATPSAAPAFSVPRPVGGVAPGIGAGGDTMEVSLAAVLKGQTAQDLGFDPAFIPGWITTKLPSADVRDQLGTGQIVLDLGTIIDGTDSTFKSVIAHGRRGFKVSIPAREVFQSMPSVAGNAYSPPPAPAAPAQPLLSNALPVLPRPPSVPLQPMIGALGSPFAQPAPHSPPTAPLIPAGPAPAPAVPPAAGEFASTPMFMPQRQREGLTGQQLMGAAPSEPSPLFAPAPEARPPSRPMFPSPAPAAATPQPPSESNPFFAATPAAPPSSPAPAFTFDESRASSKPTGMVADMSKVFGSSSNAAPEPAPAFAKPAPARATSSAPFQINASGPDEDQLVLRAMLGVADKLDISRVVELASRLPGITACAFSRDARVVAHGDSSPASQDFRQQAPEIARSMRTLAEITGLDAETLSVATKDRILTFCFQGSSSFGVMHADKEPPAGLREKITLLSREIARMST